MRIMKTHNWQLIDKEDNEVIATCESDSHKEAQEVFEDMEICFSYDIKPVPKGSVVKVSDSGSITICEK